ncbi:MAG: hypothetical protein JRI25_29885 [Deltaproteobacteria bacterium]|nr:hypothetical protein [Deltaproteobacteria bacterium]
MSDDWRAGPLVAVSAWGDAVWAAGEDGRLWGPNPADRLTAVEDGVWAATGQGLFWIDGRVAGTR